MEGISEENDSHACCESPTTFAQFKREHRSRRYYAAALVKVKNGLGIAQDDCISVELVNVEPEVVDEPQHCQSGHPHPAYPHAVRVHHDTAVRDVNRTDSLARQQKGKVGIKAQHQDVLQRGFDGCQCSNEPIK